MYRVYTASKLSTAPIWREAFARENRAHAHARWLKHVEIGTPDSPSEAVRFWIEDVEDVLTSDAVFVYAGRDEHLRGALIEAGVAIGAGIPVIVIGDSDEYGTWQHHPGVYGADDFESAFALLDRLLLYFQPSKRSPR